MTRKESVFFGALGGMCPTISMLAGSFTANPGQEMPELGVWIGLGLFALLGGIVSIGFGASEVRAAIVAGIAAPAIVTNVLSGATDPANDSDPGRMTHSFFELTAAFAQPVVVEPAPDDLSVIQRQIFVVPTIEGGLPRALNLPLSLTVVTDGVSSEVPAGAITGFSGAQEIIVPEGAISLQIGAESYVLSDELQKLDVNIATSPTLRGDLLWALGASRTYEVQSIELAPGI